MGISNTAPDHKPVDLTELVGTQLFRQVSMAQVAALLRYCPTLTLANGDRLIAPGQTVDQVHLLLRGSLQVFDGEPAGQPVGQILQGECVGLSSFVDRQPCHVSIVSNGICRLLVLDETRLMALTNTPTAVSRNLLFMLMTYLRKKAARAAEPAASPVAAPKPHNQIDAVTGLHNQRWLDETLDRLILRAATDRAPLSLIAVDVLDKSSLPMESGQESTDETLRQIAETLRRTVRPTDLLARHSNGSFLIMLPSTDLEKSNSAASRIRDAFMKVNPALAEPGSLPAMPMAIGVVQMKAFVSGRKLADDAFTALEKERETILEARRRAEAKAAAAAELAAQAEARAREEAEAEAKRLAEQAENEAWAGAEAQRIEMEIELEQMSPPPPGPATFQPNTPDVVELSDEESMALLARFTMSEDEQPGADSGSGEPAGNATTPSVTPPTP